MGQSLVRWDQVQKPTEEGGLGLFSIKDKNRVLLAKWIWRFQVEESALWREVIIAKYGLTDLRFPLSSSNRTSLGPWKDIIKQKALVLDRLTYKVGNDSTTSFWKDVWLSNEPLNTIYPLLYILYSKKTVDVKDLWSTESNSWDIRFRRNLKDAEIVELASLLHTLSFCRINNDMDRPIWRLEPHGIFSTSSLLRDLQKPPSSPEDTSMYSTIWKDHYPKKIIFFLWETSISTLNTHEKLQRRIPYMAISPHWCALCKQSIESIGHVFVSCDIANSFWSKILPLFDWLVALPSDMHSLLALTLTGHPFTKEK